MSALSKVFVPYRAYWSTPFCRWQASLAPFHSVKLGAEVTAEVLSKKGISAEVFDGLQLGITVPQQSSFYGAPWVAGMIGAPTIGGATIAQACATSARLVASAALEVEVGQRSCILNVACDRTSNGPHIYYPDPGAPGGRGRAEDWVWDNFSRDPYAKNAMLETAENVAREAGISREEQDEMTLLRNEQYGKALADDRAFHRRFMQPVTLRRGKKVLGTVEADEGVFPTTKEGLAKLKPVAGEGGTVTFGSQTHPADGNAGMIVCSKEHADKLSEDKSITIAVLGYAEARAKKGFMAEAVVPATQRAVQRAGVSLDDCSAIKTHNPFAVNDVYFCKQTGVAPDKLNAYGSPLIYGHPQAPTGLRAMIELIEQLVINGGGVGLFSGCAAGDTAMAVVFKVS